MWRTSAIACVLAGLSIGPASAEPMPDERACLSYGDTAEIVAARKVIAPGQAMVAARRAVPDGDIMRASLCRKADALVYRLTAIRSDGRVVLVTVDAPSGKVHGIR